MKKGWIIAIIALIVIAIIAFVGFRWFTNKNNNMANMESKYQASRTLAEDLNARKPNNKSNA